MPADNEGSAPETPAEPAITAADLQALRDQLAAASERTARLEGELAATRAPEPQAPKEFTRAELQQAVDNGTITEEKRDEILEEQRERKLTAKLEAKLEAKLAANQSQSRIQEDLTRYIEAHPGIEQAGHPDRLRLEREYQHLLSIGLPKGAATEAAAARAVFGPVEKIRETTRQNRERHVETGGGSGGGDEGDAAPSWHKGLSPRQRSYYAKKLEGGFYAGEDDPSFKREIAIARGESPAKVLARTKPRPGERRVMQ